MLSCPEIAQIKLKEMEQAYFHLQRRMEAYQEESSDIIQREIEQMNADCLEYNRLLSKIIQGSKTPLVARLADAQLNYNQQTQAIMESAAHTSETLNAQVEAASIYAEFAIDQAIHGMNNALLAAMVAAEKQREADQNNKEDAK